MGLLGMLGGSTQAGRLSASLDLDAADYNRGLDDAEGRARSFGNTFTSSLQRIGEVASGILVANVIGGIVNQIQSLAASAIGATAQMQQMQVGLEGLMARELAQGQEVITQKKVWVEATGAQLEKIQALTRKQQEASLSLKEQEIHYNDLVKRYGEAGIATQKFKLQMEDTRATIASYGKQIDALGGAQGHYATVTDSTRVNVKEMADVMPEAQVKAKKMMDELARIAILSPYQVEAVQATFRQAMAYGFGADEAVKFTQAMLNVAAGVGAGNEQLQRMGYNFAQIRMQGKVTRMDVMQLAMAGFDLMGVLKFVGEQSHVTVNSIDDFNAAIANGKIKWSDFADNFQKYADKNFGSAAERMSRTLVGLQSTLSDLFVLTMPTVIGPAVEEFTSLLNGLLNQFLRIRDSGVLEQLGARMAAFSKATIAPITGLIGTIEKYQKLQETARTSKDINEIVAAEKEMARMAPTGNILLDSLGLSPATREMIAGVSAQIGAFAGQIRTTVGAVFGWLSANVVPLLDRALVFLNQHWQEVFGAIKALAAFLAGAALFSTIASLAGALASLASPITLIMTAVALLGAAWAGNWYGMRDRLLDFWARARPVIEAVWNSVTGVIDGIRTTLSGGDFPWEDVLPPRLADLAYNIVGSLEALVYYTRQLFTSTEPLPKRIGDFVSQLLQIAMVSPDTANKIGGVVSSIVDFGQKAGVWLGENVPRAITAVREAWETTWPKVQNVLTTAWSVIGPPLTKLFEVLGALPGLLQSFASFNFDAGAMQEIFGGFLTNMFGDLSLTNRVDQFITRLRDVFETLKGVAAQIGQFLAPMFSRVSQAFGGISAQSGPLVESLGRVWEGIKALGAYLVELWNFLEPVRVAIGVTLVAAFDLLGNLVAGFARNILPILTDAFNIVADTLQAIARIAGDMVRVVGDLFRGDFAGAWAELGDVVNTVADWLKRTFDNIVDIIRHDVDAWITPLLDWLGDLTGWRDQISSVVASVGAFFSGLGEPIGAAAGLISTLWNNLVANIQLGIDLVRSLLAGNWGAVWNDALQMLANFQSSVSAIWNALVGVLDIAAAAIRTAIIAQFDTLVTDAKSRLASVTKNAQDQLEGLRKWIIDQAKNFIAAGQALFDGLVEGVKAGWRAALDAIQGLVNLLPAFVKKALGISSPSRVFMEIGRQTVAGLAEGFRASRSTLEAALDDYVSRPVLALQTPAFALAGPPDWEQHVDGRRFATTVNVYPNGQGEPYQVGLAARDGVDEALRSLGVR